MLLAVYATLLVLGAVVITKAYRDTRVSAREEALERLGDATALLAAQINGDHVDLLLERYSAPGLLIKPTQDAWYYVMHDHLRRTTEQLDLDQPLLILAWDNEGGGLHVVATADKVPALRTPYPGDAAAVRDAVAQGAKRLVLRGNNELVAFDIVRNGADIAVGIVAGRMALSVAEAPATESLWQHILIASLLFALTAILLFGSVGRWLRRDEQVHDALRKQHGQVSDSIAYAAKIQRALVPAPSVYNELFDDSFVIDIPKDVLSGDFHWYHRVDENTCYVAAADCTGHGLPGAMIAAIGCSLLNEVVPRNSASDPAELLGILNTRLVTTLHQQGRKQGAGDGMDLALCRIDRGRGEILFAGAQRPLYWLHRGRVTVINGDRKPIGGAHQELDRRYTVHRLAYDPGDRIYLFSDGYVDQFGGPDHKRFMSSRLQSLLQENRDLSMARQAQVLEDAFHHWKGDHEQVDDVCMLAIAV